MANIADLLGQSADVRPDYVAIKVDENELSYAALDRAAARVAGLLRTKGVQPHLDAVNGQADRPWLAFASAAVERGHRGCLGESEPLEDLAAERLADDAGNPVAAGDVGEISSRAAQSPRRRYYATSSSNA